MKRTLLILSSIACASVSMAQYQRDGIRLCRQIDLPQFTGSPTGGSGCSGYVSPSGREYVVMGLRNGTSIVDVTNPDASFEVGHVDGPASIWHESVVAGHYAYCVTEAGGGMQIIDLSNVDNGIVGPTTVYTGNGLSTVHTIETNSHYLYLNGSNRNFCILDIANPTAPVEVARWTTRYVHDSVIVTHTSGPYAGHEIAYLCCGGSGVTIVDVTDKNNLVTLGSTSYVTNGYCHSGSLTPDYRYFLVNDEFDEGNAVVTDTTTHVIDVSNLSNIFQTTMFINPIGVIDHNSVLKDGFLNLAAYRGGLRVYNASNPTSMSENGYFDTYPSGQGFSYDGAWGTFVFPSGTTAIADINRGLFVVDPSEARNQGAPLRDLSYLSGANASGGLKELKFADGSAMITLWNESSQSADPLIDLVVGSETTRSPAAFIDLTLKAHVSGASAAYCTVKLKNWTTGQFTSVGTLRLAASDGTYQITGIAAAPYVSTNSSTLGRIEVELVAAPKGLSDIASLALVTDQLKVSVRKN